MTPEQVSALSDTELNRAMIWLFYNEFKEGYPELEFVEDSGSVVSMDLGDYVWEPNYLNDYNLTMPLAFSNDLSISICGSTERKAIVVCDSHSAHDGNPLRAICECLVLLKLGK